MGNNAAQCIKISVILLANKWMILRFVLDILKVARMLVKVTLVDLWCATSMAKLLLQGLSVGVKDVLNQVIQESTEESLKFWIGSSLTWAVKQQAPLQLLLLQPQLQLDALNHIGKETTIVTMSTTILNAITMEEIVVVPMLIPLTVPIANA